VEIGIVLQDELPERAHTDVGMALLKNSSAVVTDGNHRGVRFKGDVVWRCLPAFTDGRSHDFLKLPHFVFLGTAADNLHSKTLLQIVLYAQT
jgi:hypothetical protein